MTRIHPRQMLEQQNSHNKIVEFDPLRSGLMLRSRIQRGPVKVLVPESAWRANVHAMTQIYDLQDFTSGPQENSRSQVRVDEAFAMKIVQRFA